MRRREFISFLGGGAAAAWPRVVDAQQPARLPQVAILRGDDPEGLRNSARSFRDCKHWDGRKAATFGSNNVGPVVLSMQ